MIVWKLDETMVLLCIPCWCYVVIWIWLKYALANRYSFLVFVALFIALALVVNLVADIVIPEWEYIRNFTAPTLLAKSKI